MTNEEYKAIEEVIARLHKLLDEVPMPDVNYHDVLDMQLILEQTLKGRVVF